MAQSTTYDLDVYQPRNPKESAYYKCVENQNPDYYLLTALIALFYFKNLLTQPGTGTTCCASARLGAYFNSLIFFHTFLD
jgi:hypothetical protein